MSFWLFFPFGCIRKPWNIIFTIEDCSTSRVTMRQKPENRAAERGRKA